VKGKPLKPHLVILKSFTEQLAPVGFSRLKTSWWERKSGLFYQRIHVHKFTFTTSFRVHAALHLAGLDEEAVSLNGIYSCDGWFERRILGLPVGRHSFDYTESPDTWQRSADTLFLFARDVLLPWFDEWSDAARLQEKPDSPLNEQQKNFLKRQRPT
jgi:hypothetical protein